jgi:NADH-quinone oxidoreductase subunit M
VHDENRRLPDLAPREVAVVAPVLALCLLLGLYPAPFLRRIEPAVRRTIALVERRTPPPAPAAAAAPPLAARAVEGRP